MIFYFIIYIKVLNKTSKVKKCFLDGASHTSTTDRARARHELGTNPNRLHPHLHPLRSQEP